MESSTGPKIELAMLAISFLVISIAIFFLYHGDTLSYIYNNFDHLDYNYYLDLLCYYPNKLMYYLQQRQ